MSPLIKALIDEVGDLMELLEEGSPCEDCVGRARYLAATLLILGSGLPPVLALLTALAETEQRQVN